MFLFFDGVIIPPPAVDATYLGAKRVKRTNKEGILGLAKPPLGIKWDTVAVLQF